MASDPTAFVIDGYGTTHVTNQPPDNPADDDPMSAIVAVTFERMRRTDIDEDVPGAWVLQLFPEEALRLAGALIEHARRAVV